MPNLPTITAQQVAEVITGVTNVEHIGQGGQKVVFKAVLDEGENVFKFISLPVDTDSVEAPLVDVTARARREVEIMRDCTSRHMIKPGPIELTFAKLEGQDLLYFSEEFIDGRNLKEILTETGPFSADEIIKLGLQIADALKELWDLGKIHRDVKPSNIMRRREGGDNVLLDAGLAFDVIGESLSAGFVVGTPMYFSPEQFDYSSRRTVLDFRSDMFALGVTLYELATGQHPFWGPGISNDTFYANVRTQDPPSPTTIRDDLSNQLSQVILRTLGKSPHLRYRKWEHFIGALNQLQ